MINTVATVILQRNYNVIVTYRYIIDATVVYITHMVIISLVFMI